MIIVSQNKNNIINFDNVALICVLQDMFSKEKGLENYNINCSTNNGINIGIGTYATKERAKEVLEEIISKYMEYASLTNIQGDIRQICVVPKKYEMPKE